MFPAVEQAILQNNPQFAALHKTLTTELLNPSGSSRAEPQQAERDAVRKALQQHRLHAAKAQLLRNAVLTFDIAHADLPETVEELVHLLRLRLTTKTLDPDAGALLYADDLFAALPDHLPLLAERVSAHLQTQLRLVSRLLPAPDTASTAPARVQRLRADVAAARPALAAAHHALLVAVCAALAAYRRATAATLDALERRKHGVHARRQMAAAGWLAAQARVERGQLQRRRLEAAAAVYAGEAAAALRAYVLHLRDAGTRVVERGRQAKRELAAYGVLEREGEEDLNDPVWQSRQRKEVVMKEIARVYAEVLAELNDVRADVERLRES